MTNYNPKLDFIKEQIMRDNHKIDATKIEGGMRGLLSLSEVIIYFSFIANIE